jgi:hypothetical protein
MYLRSTLSHSDAVSAIELFEQGLTAKSVALALDLAANPVQMLYERWQVRGSGALMTRDRKQYDIKTKLLIVRRHLQGVSGRVLAKVLPACRPGAMPGEVRRGPIAPRPSFSCEAFRLSGQRMG